MSRPVGPDILADFGGTNARLMLSHGATFGAVRRYKVADFSGPAQAIRRFLRDVAPDAPPRRAAIAVAGPVAAGEADLTNSEWTISAAALQRDLALDRVLLLNDFAALAWALPGLADGDLFTIGGGRRLPGSPMAVLGPGTGLGVAAFVPDRGGVVLATEGGHVTMPAVDDREAEILRRLRARYDHVSAERTLSGAGLEALYGAVSAVDGIAGPDRTAPEITERALAGDCVASRATLETFCAMLGGFAGDVALSMGARGGVFVAGGIVPRFPDFMAQSRFRERFEAKGRFRDWLAAIPTFVVSHPDPAFPGLRAALDAAA